MANHTQAIEWLRGQGLRLTPQRLLILSAIAEGGGHLAVDEIYRRAKEAYPYIDIATVYRTLHLLKKLGVVTEVGMGDRLHFELSGPGRKHHHMVCRDCGNAFDLSPGHLKAFRKTLVEKFGFEPDLDNFTISGVCAQCAPSAQPRRRRGG
ncbi:MAG: transcriptional repressor [Chloroflexi bacterium]|nr:transcriptional repressor [Chloroflexota bacterium]